MDDSVLEEIRFHQDVVAKDANSPLFQIREKEMEISGRILAARNQAEKIISDARAKAAETVKGAGGDAERLAKEHAERVAVETESKITEIGTQGEAEVVALEDKLKTRQSEAADLVVKMVTTV